MSHYSVKVFFEEHPKLKEVFETYDGVIHVNKEIAERWVSRHANKTITTHQNPRLKESDSSDLGSAKTAKNGTGKGKRGQGKVVIPKDENQEADQLTPPGEGETPNPDTSGDESQDQGNESENNNPEPEQ